MKKQDLDALGELYFSVYGNQLNELSFSDAIPRIPGVGLKPGEANRIYNQARAERAKNERAQLGVVKGGNGGKFVAKTLGMKPGETADQWGERNSRAVKLANRLNIETGLNKREPTPTRTPTVSPRPTGTPAGSSPRPAAGSGSTPPPRPAARPSGPVLSKKNGVEGTGVGANFKARAFTAAEKSRYASVAAQNAAKSSASSGTPKPSSTTPAAAQPKPPTPAIGKLGSTSFERRTPTSAELRAAQAERATQKASGQDTSSVKNAEKALQAAQKTNLPTTGPSPATPDLGSVGRDLARANTVANLNSAPAGSAAAKALAAKPATSAPTPTQIAGASQGIKPINNKKPTNEMSSYEWPSAKTIRDIAGAYASIYEAKKKVDQDQDGDNDFADVRIARMIASGVPKEVAIAKVRSKSYNEEIEIDEATRMRKELGKEGETETRQELARRSKAFKRSGSVDKTIAAAERGADRPYIKHKRDESDADRKKREEKQSRTLRGLAASRRGSVRDTPRVELRGYAAKVEGSDKNLQRARSSAMSAGTLTPKEKKQLGEEYQIYEIVASYLLENNFAETLNDANVIIENMSENWVGEILEAKKPLPVSKMKKKESKLLDNEEGHLKALRTDVGSKERKARMKELQRFDNINSARTSIAKRGGKQQHSMPEVGRYKSKDED